MPWRYSARGNLLKLVVMEGVNAALQRDNPARSADLLDSRPIPARDQIVTGWRDWRVRNGGTGRSGDPNPGHRTEAKAPGT